MKCINYYPFYNKTQAEKQQQWCTFLKQTKLFNLRTQLFLIITIVYDFLQSSMIYMRKRYQ